MSKYGVFAGPYFSEFGLNTEIFFRKSPFSVRIQENTDRKNSVFRHFSYRENKVKMLFTIVLEPHSAAVSEHSDN